MPFVQAVRQLRLSDGDEGFVTPPSKVNNMARNLFLRVNNALGEIEQGHSPQAMAIAM